MEVRIRAMEPPDMEAVLGIYRQGIERGDATFERECPTPQAWDAGHLPACRLVACDGDEILGWAALSRVSARWAYRGVAELSVYVDGAKQGLGVGRRLLGALMERAPQDGFWTLQATVLDGNAGSARLHEKMGFRLVGRRERIAVDAQGRWRDTLLYEWRKAE